jgi:hypothetical protein
MINQTTINLHETRDLSNNLLLNMMKTRSGNK